MDAGISATDPPPFLFQLLLDDSGFIPVYSFPQKCIVSSHHILLITQNTQQKLSSNQGFFKETAHSPAQLSPFSRLVTPLPTEHPRGLAFCNHPWPFHSSWGSTKWSIRRLSLFLKPFGSFDHIKFVRTSGLLH